MPRLADLQKRVSSTGNIFTQSPEGREEVLVADRRASLTPAQQVDAKFWAALAAVRPAQKETSGPRQV